MSAEKTDHVVIADLHGSDEAFVSTLFVLNAIDTSGTWTREGSSLTLLGDILADRNEHGLQIMKRIAGLREQIEKAGGELTVVAGNHEGFALEYLGGHAMSMNLIQKVGYRELFRLAMGRDPADDAELMKTSLEGDLLTKLQGKEEAKPLFDFLTRLKLFHTAEHEGGAKTLFLHAPPDEDTLALLLSTPHDTLNAKFQEELRAYLSSTGEVFPIGLSNEFKGFQWGEWDDCPDDSSPIWTDLRNQEGIRRLICGHREKEAERWNFSPVEMVALDRKFGLFPRTTHPKYWEGGVSGGILKKDGTFTF